MHFPALISAPQQKSAIEQALQEAEDCGDPKSKECATAWDNVSSCREGPLFSGEPLFALCLTPPNRCLTPGHARSNIQCAQVEEASAAAAHKKQNEQMQDPMEKFCEGNEDADECRVYGEARSNAFT